MTTPPTSHEALRKKWAEDCQTLGQQLSSVLFDQSVWTGMRDRLVESSDTSSLFLEHYARLYATSQAVAVRRFIDRDSRSISLVGLLAAFSKNPEALTRERFLECSVPPDLGDEFLEVVLPRQSDFFETKFGDGAGGFCIDKNESRRAQLVKASAGIKKLVDKTVAHHDRTGIENVPSFDELDTAISMIEAVLLEASMLVAGTAPDTFTPTPQEDWRAPFALRFLNRKKCLLI